MDITPLYELRTRLKTSMIAGTNLLQEDFRLKRAVEAIQPLLPVSPVFAKIGQLSAALLKPEQEGREGLLLDTITLVDAVLCTQGTVTAAGEIEPLITGSYGTAITNAPYSAAKALLDALENSGGGRYSYVVDMHQSQPELFADYRIRTALVRALGASYAELAEQVAQWLKEEGECIIPLLKGGFDPKGKKEMVRRVQILDAIAKDKENDFYLAQLPEAEKEVRQTLIYALRHSPENIDRLLEMTKSEKGNSKKAAYYALACRPDDEAEAFFRKLMKRRPDDVLSYIEMSDTDWAADITAASLREQLTPWANPNARADSEALTKEQAALICLALRALPFKRGEEIRECYRLALSVGKRLDKPLEGDKAVWETREFLGNNINLTFRFAVPKVLCKALMLHPDKELSALSEELYREASETEQESEYFITAFTAKLLTEENCCAWLREQMAKRSLNKKKVSVTSCIEEALKTLRWEPDKKTYTIQTGMISPVDGKYFLITQEVPQAIQGEFTDILTELGSTVLDDILSHCISPEDTKYRDRLLSYFYQRALTVSNNRNYCYILRENGWTKCEGIAMTHFKGKNTIDRWELSIYLSQMPGDDIAKAEEMLKVVELIQSGKLKSRNTPKEWLEQFSEQLKYTCRLKNDN